MKELYLSSVLLCETYALTMLANVSEKYLILVRIANTVHNLTIKGMGGDGGDRLTTLSFRKQLTIATHFNSLFYFLHSLISLRSQDFVEHVCRLIV